MLACYIAQTTRKFTKHRFIPQSAHNIAFTSLHYRSCLNSLVYFYSPMTWSKITLLFVTSWLWWKHDYFSSMCFLLYLEFSVFSLSVPFSNDHNFLPSLSFFPSCGLTLWPACYHFYSYFGPCLPIDCYSYHLVTCGWVVCVCVCVRVCCLNVCCASLRTPFSMYCNNVQCKNGLKYWH